MRSFGLIVALLALPSSVGCAKRERLPPSHADSEATTGFERARDPQANDPARVEVRRIHAACDRTIAALEEGVGDASRRENILTAVAALAYVVGRLADNGGAEGGLYGPGQPQSYRCSPGTNEGPGCGPEPLPSVSAGEGGPIDRDTDRVHLDAADQIRHINRGVDALDEFLFSNPDSGAWTETDRAEFDDLTGALSAACDD